MAKQTKLKFAALIRVSTEQQEKTGESLRTQKAKIEKDVELLGGKIVGWYGGQEHAMPGYEKKEVNRLLDDAPKKKFNAVIVTKADRWSRDNKTSQKGIDVFKKNKIRFFASVTEYDLYNPDHLLILGMSAVIGQFFGNNQNKESLLNRIARAKRGMPTGGKLPYGRTFDKKTEQWGIDKEKKAIIEDCAKRYLAGENIVHLAAEYGVNYSSLFKTLMHRSGDVWGINFNSDEFNIHEFVPIEVPRLLPETTIKKLHKRCKANKTYSHGNIKNQYLLSRMLFCYHCGYALSGAVNHGNRRYRHAHGKRKKQCTGNPALIDADVLEEQVMGHLFEMFGNPKALEEALEKAMPNLDKIKEYHARLQRHEQTLERLAKHRQTIMNRERKGTITEDEAEKQLAETTKEKERLESEVQRLSGYMQNVPNPSSLKAVAKNVTSQFKGSSYGIARRRAIAKNINANYDKMTYEQKRALCEMVFSGERPDGSRMGVYVKWDNEGQWSFSIHGHLINVEDMKPIADWDFSESTAHHQTRVTKYALC